MRFWWRGTGSTSSRYGTRAGDRELGAGTVLRVGTTLKASGRGEALVRGERVRVTEAGGDRIHIATLDRNKDLVSLYVSVTRGRDRTVFVADARDWLTDADVSASCHWLPGQLDDEVLERVVTHLAGKPERIDSPSRAMAPRWEPSQQVMASHLMGMSL